MKPKQTVEVSLLEIYMDKRLVEEIEYLLDKQRRRGNPFSESAGVGFEILRLMILRRPNIRADGEWFAEAFIRNRICDWAVYFSLYEENFLQPCNCCKNVYNFIKGVSNLFGNEGFNESSVEGLKKNWLTYTVM